MGDGEVPGLIVAAERGRSRLYHGDAFTVIGQLPDESIDAVVTDPPYGLEFMGKEWDSFRVDDRSARWSSATGEAGSFGEIPSGSQLPAYGKRRTTSQCQACGRRDAFRNPHDCGDAADWRTIYVDVVPVEMRAFQNWCSQWAAECYRVLKPGGHLLAFGGTRTYHRMACGVEDVGFEVRDSLHWLYGSGFPKSLAVGKAIDKAAGHDRTSDYGPNHRNEVYGEGMGGGAKPGEYEQDPPVTEGGVKWEGWGTALKPSHEPIIVARKPLLGTVASNVLEHGTGALNVDATRVPVADDDPVNTAVWTSRPSSMRPGTMGFVTSHDDGDRRPTKPPEGGRWPPNVLVSHSDDCTPEACAEGCPVPIIGEQGGGEWPARTAVRHNLETGDPVPGEHATYEIPRQGGPDVTMDGGNASRFFPTFQDEDDDSAVSSAVPFRYTPKAKTTERSSGLDHLPELRQVALREKQVRECDDCGRHQASGVDADPVCPRCGCATWHWAPMHHQGAEGPNRNAHPTVKPVGLMRWLLTLVVPPGGIFLDPFVGSGSTIVAAVAEGIDWLAIEREPSKPDAPDYVALAVARLEAAERAVRARRLRDRRQASQPG